MSSLRIFAMSYNIVRIREKKLVVNVVDNKTKLLDEIVKEDYSPTRRAVILSPLPKS